MEKELNKILDKIEEIYYSGNAVNSHKELSLLWTKYYQLSSSYNIELERAYNLYLIGESESYILNTNINYKPSLETPTEIIEKLKNNQNKSLTIKEANSLLTWVVNRTWKNLSHLGIDITCNSLNGFCEIAQVCSLYILESLGLKVTKNNAESSFDYKFHHVFGTVTIPIDNNGTITNQIFLIDPTYKQFFTTVRCNHGRYYAKEENTGLIVAPDPGYFMKTEKEIEISKSIIENGYILLTEEVAKIYGDGFKKASISLENYYENELLSNNTGKYYIDRIKNTSTNYYIDISKLEGYAFDFDIPNSKKKL